MGISCKSCTSDEDLAEASLFLLKNKRSLHPSFTTMDTVSLIYSYITDGHLFQLLDSSNKLIGVWAYYHGTPERNFEDKEVIFMDIAILDKAYRGTRIFIQGLALFVNQVIADYPDVQEIRLAALSANTYICRLYSKIFNTSHKREGSIGEETVFSTNIDQIRSFIKKFVQV